MDEKFIEFLLKHEGENPSDLALKRDRYPEIDMQLAARCIAGRQKARRKLPAWYARPEILYPSSIALEQCSSEPTALYKQRLVSSDDRVADLTGGLGVDSWAIAGKAAHLDYYERNTEIASTARHNFKVLSMDNIRVNNREIRAEDLQELPTGAYTLFYVDPARRGEAGQRVFALEDCEPDILAIKELLLQKAQRILLKVSPMSDLRALCMALPETTQIHVVALEGECKEVLLQLERGSKLQPEDIPIHATDLSGHGGSAQTFTFTIREEAHAEVCMAAREELKGYLYDPSACLLKSGAFKLPAVRYGLLKVAAASHYYVSREPVPGFPGKVRRIEAVLPFNKATIRGLRRMLPACSVTARNFPLSSEELRKRLGCAESSVHRAFATTASDGNYVIIVTERL